MPPMAPMAYALNHPMVHPGQAGSQFNYMYSEGSEEEVDSEG